MKKVAPKVKNGYFTLGVEKCDKCKKDTLLAYGNRIGMSMHGTYHADGKELCRLCAKKLGII